MSNPTFAKNGRVKSFKATWFQAMIGMFLRTIVVAFAEILIFVIVDLSQDVGTSKLASVSRIIAYVLTVTIIAVFIAIASYRIYLYSLERENAKILPTAHEE